MVWMSWTRQDHWRRISRCSCGIVAYTVAHAHVFLLVGDACSCSFDAAWIMSCHGKRCGPYMIFALGARMTCQDNISALFVLCDV